MQVVRQIGEMFFKDIECRIAYWDNATHFYPVVCLVNSLIVHKQRKVYKYTKQVVCRYFDNDEPLNDTEDAFVVDKIKIQQFWMDKIFLAILCED